MPDSTRPVPEGSSTSSTSTATHKRNSPPPPGTGKDERSRYALKACEECRWRRAKCDGNKPSCSRCLGRQLQCVYTADDDGRGTTPKSYVRLLQAWISVFEWILQLHSIDVDASAAYLLEQDLCTVLEGTLALDEDLNFDQDGEARYFGTISGRLAFQILKETQEFSLPGHYSQVLNLYTQAVQDENQIPEELETHLLDLYFTWEQPWCQVVDERLFRETPKKPSFDDRYTGRFFVMINWLRSIRDVFVPCLTFKESYACLLYLIRMSMASAAPRAQLAAHPSSVYKLPLAHSARSLKNPSQSAPKRPTHDGHKRTLFDSCLLALRNWYYSLPPELKPVGAGKANQFPQAYTLCMVYHTAVILLTKPYLKDSGSPAPSRAQQLQQDPSTQKPWTLHIEAANNICSLGEQCRQVFGGFRKSPIAATHCTLSAALALLYPQSQSLQDTGLKNIDMDKVKSCLNTLQELSQS
ncbi:hypothetical protein BO70DRAFT_392410 [Aspergillus heteromorphus CBS 117.55]|uniref:Zn(2)-C6 fungal-type domain-containing protein n=1 Tax=Aspergillus heteromorphus CBS 117.55 TaxID=1448321 RepID=A0A317WXI5_9EURO|nr:uncharacterized protein BO70DRAFT_392410 [Aspergillus heteromorphus CBS 117.55]PWY90725.1 hypothetical protein BO70DRAFT_392410 [Aspergillus heteromorphus CBS 117.55]